MRRKAICILLAAALAVTGMTAGVLAEPGGGAGAGVGAASDDAASGDISLTDGAEAGDAASDTALNAAMPTEDAALEAGIYTIRPKSNDSVALLGGNREGGGS